MDLDLISSLAAALDTHSVDISNVISSLYVDGLIIALEEKRKDSGHCDLDTLQQLSVKCVIQNFKKFVVNNNPYCAPGFKNPFANLSNLLVQVLLDALASRETLLPDYHSSNGKVQAYCFVLQLLNPFILEGKINSLEKFISKISSAALFKHLLMNCPRIQKVEIDEQIWSDFLVLPRLTATCIYKMMSMKWSTLTCLCQSFKCYSVSSDTILQEISNNLPKLSVLSISLSSATFTLEGVKHLSEMKKVKQLQLFVTGSKDVTLLVHAAGQTPSLEQFDFWDENQLEMSDFGTAFVDLYGTLYPEKQLTITKLLFQSDLTNKWPKCLSVTELQFKQSLRFNFGSKNLLDGNNCCVTNLMTECIPPSKIYPLVEKFGPAGLVQVSINCLSYPNGYDVQVEPLDLHRVVAVCPNLKVLIIKSREGCETTSPYKVTPKHFQNYKCFEMYHMPGMVPEVSDLFRMYLIGSKTSRKNLVVSSEEVLDFLLSLMKQNWPTCYDQVMNINFSFRSEFTVQLLDKALQLVFLLVTRSPNVRSIYFENVISPAFRDHRPVKWLLKIFQKLNITLQNYRGKLDLTTGKWPE